MSFVLVTAVVACGSCGSGPGEAGMTATAEDTAVWTPIADAPLSPRHGAWAAAVGDRVLIVGGRDTPACPPNASCVAPEGSALRDGALYDPSDGTWEPITDAPVPIDRNDQTVTLESTAWSVQSWDPTAALVVGYDVDAHRWRTEEAPSPSGGRLARFDGSLLVYPGSHENIGVIPDRVFHPASGTWEELPRDPVGLAYDRSYVHVPAGLVLLAIPLVAPPPDRPRVYQAALYDHTTHEWTALPPSEIAGYAGAWYRAGSDVINPTLGSADGGQINPWDRAYPFGGILDVSGRRWLPLPAGRDPGVGSGSTPVADGERWVVSSMAGPPGPLTAFDLDARRWADLEMPPSGIPTGASIAMSKQWLVIWGGATFDAEPRGVLRNGGVQLALQ